MLKIDLVNDTAPHYGEFEYNASLGKIDSWRNILSNKLTALYRYEIKDIFDIWTIAKAFSFDWQEIIREVRTKDAGVDPIIVADILRNIPTIALKEINYINPPDINEIKTDLTKIAEDIFYGRNNLSTNYLEKKLH